MAEQRSFVVFGFASVHDTMAADSLLSAAGIHTQSIPSPRELGALCGIALRLEPGSAERALGVLNAGGSEPLAQATITDY